MATATERQFLRGTLGLVAGAVLAVLGARDAVSMSIDDRGEMRLGLRSYTDVRLGTEKEGGTEDPLSYPSSGAGHLRQHRYFLQLKFDHDLKRLSEEGYGFARAFGWMNLDEFGYSLQYRGEGEGIYDYGPPEWSDQGRRLRQRCNDLPNIPGLIRPCLDQPANTITHPDGTKTSFIDERVSRLRRLARQRHRFYSGYLDARKGPFFLRVGRQVLAWGETDIFRLLDNINPTDASFGGFLIALDERRIPIDMIRGSWRFDSIGPLTDAFLEGFAAVGNKVSQFPGTPGGSAWSPGGIGSPNPQLRQTVDLPAREDLRGGARFVFNWSDATVTLAHYYSYLDVPGTRFKLPGQKQCIGETSATNTARYCNPINAFVKFPRIPITGGSVTFPVPSWYAVVRSEMAYLVGEPFSRQGTGNTADNNFGVGTPETKRLVAANNTEGGVNPFVYPRFLDLGRERPVNGSTLQLNTFNFSVGLDVQRFIRWLNPQQTLFFSTQAFYKHVFDSPGDLVLPTPHHNNPVNPNTLILGNSCKTPKGKNRPCRIQPRFFGLEDDQMLHTFAVFTSYLGGQVNPILGAFYDWQGAWVVQPGVSLVRDPFRFVMDYSAIFGAPTGQLGTLRDRDNVRFQVEFVF